MSTPQDTPEWQALEALADSHQNTTLQTLFAEDPTRFERYQIEAAGVFLDYSKNLLTDDIQAALLALAKASPLEARRSTLFGGGIINPTEGRPALHTALRDRSGQSVEVAGRNVLPDVEAVLSRLARFTEQVRSGDWRGHTGLPITDVVNIGIGGSDLGPLMAVEALEPFAHPRLTLHFVSNVDGAHMGSTLKALDPATTLFIVASKTFTTQETLTNAHTARAWLLEAPGFDKAAIAHHFAAVSTNAEAVAEFGIDTDNMFGFWDWVGGRYSLWSAIGVSLMLSVGYDRFVRFLEGGQAMDTHFRTAALAENLPVTLALLTVWYSNFFGAETHLVVPYDQSLHRLPAYLQQLTMESNGKSVHVDGSPVAVSTGPVVWGEPGTNGQHAFFQLLHQGTHRIPVDFLLPMESLYPVGDPPGIHHTLLIANCLAQSEALMMGKSGDAVAAEMREAGASEEHVEALTSHRTFSGNRPSNTIMVPRLDPYALGTLVALYEHKVFVEAAIWDINPFDQWGVELGKQLAKSIHAELEDARQVRTHDSSTNGLLNRVLAHRGQLS